MKKQRNNSQLKLRKFLWRKSEINLFSLTDTQFKKKVIKVLKELRKDSDRNEDYCKKELETIMRTQENLENPFAKMKSELKGMNSRMNNAEE